MNRRYVCIAVCLTLKLLLVFNPVSGRYVIFVSCCPYWKILQWRWCVCLSSLTGWNHAVGSVRLGRTFVLMCAWLQSCYLCSMHCEALIQSSLGVQIYNNGGDLYAYLRWMDATMLRRRWTNRKCKTNKKPRRAMDARVCCPSGVGYMRIYIVCPDSSSAEWWREMCWMWMRAFPKMS